MKINEKKLKKRFTEILPGVNEKTIDRLMYAVYWVLDEHRTPAQNASLHLLFKQISDTCMEHGIEMRDIVRDEIPIPCTPENIKWLWKRLQEKMFQKKSTTELKKTGEIDEIYDAFNRILIERTNGEVGMPDFPSEKLST